MNGKHKALERPKEATARAAAALSWVCGMLSVTRAFHDKALHFLLLTNLAASQDKASK